MAKRRGKSGVLRAFYIFTNGYTDDFKIGIHKGSVSEFINRYITAIPNLEILYFHYVGSIAKSIEDKVKAHFYNERVINYNGSRSEWIKVDYVVLYDYVKTLVPDNNKVIIDKHLNINNYVRVPRKPRSDNANNINMIHAQEKIVNMMKSTNDPKLIEISEDETRFINNIKSLLLHYNSEFDCKDILINFTNKFPFVKESKRLAKVLYVIRWMENELGINRFDLVNLKVDDPTKIINKMIDKIDKFAWLSYKGTKSARVKQIKKRILKLQLHNTENHIKRFFMNIIRQFDKNLYHYQKKRVGNKKITTYFDFEFNESIIENHIAILTCLDINPKDIHDIVRTKIDYMIQNGRVEVPLSELKNYPPGSLFSYMNKDNVFRLAGFIVQHADDSLIYIDTDFSQKHRVWFHNIHKIWLGDVYKVTNNDIFSLCDTLHNKTNYPVEINETVIYYAKDKADVKKFKESEKYQKYAKWINYFDIGVEN